MADLRLLVARRGAIGARVAKGLSARGAPVQLVEVGLNKADAPRVGRDATVPLLTDPADLVVGVAGSTAVMPWGLAAHGAGADDCPASASAHADGAAPDQLVPVARAHDCQILIPSGAQGGLDALSAAGRLPLTSVPQQFSKPSLAGATTPAEAAHDLASLTGPLCLFEGSAAEAFAQNANVAVISAVAGMGLARTKVRLIADPALTMIRHRVVAEGDFGRMKITLDNRALASDPQASKLAAPSLARLIENRTATLVT